MSKTYREVRRVGRKRGRKGPVIIVILIVIAAIVAGMFYVKSQEDGSPSPSVGTQLLERTNEKDGYAISSSSKEATLAAEDVLKAGGNAVDAAVALSYTLAVVEPYASGIGGGGCMVVYDPKSDDYYFYNYGSEASTSGYTGNILIPGMVSGMDAVLSDFGTKELAELLQPAISYCDGFQINDALEIRINSSADSLGENSVFFQNGDWLAAGDTVTQPELKATLELIAEEGPEAFYTGKIAKDIAEATGLSQEDLASYETIVTRPVIGDYCGYEIVAAGMPYSGTTLIQMLKMAEVTQMPNPEENNQKYVDFLRNITVLSHADRVKNVYDYEAAGTTADTENMVSDAYIQELLASDVSGIMWEEESEDTTAFTIIDADGMVVSCTNTLSSFFGSKEVVDGFYLNNTGRNFGSDVNAPESGKRPRSHITPAILRSEDEVIAIASPGGDVIVKVLSTVLIDICQFDTEPQEAVDKQRVMFESNNTIYYEIGYETPSVADVFDTGYTAIPNSSHSKFGAIALSGYSEETGYYGVTDVRRDGHSVSAN